MKVVFEIGDHFPKSCDNCPLFVNQICGYSAFCVADGEYTEEEIEAEEDGELNMYYNGCLETRPKNCPLKEVEV